MEWSASLVAFIIAATVVHVIEMGVFIWYLSGRLTRIEGTSTNNGKEISKVESSLGQHIEAFDDHIADGRLHTTEEQRKDMSRRIDRLESLIRDSVRDLGVKIDNWAARTLGK